MFARTCTCKGLPLIWRTLRRYITPYLIWVNFPTSPHLLTGQTELFSYFGYCLFFSVCWAEGGMWKLTWREWKVEGAPSTSPQVFWEKRPFWSVCFARVSSDDAFAEAPTEVSPVLKFEKRLLALLCFLCWTVYFAPLFPWGSLAFFWQCFSAWITFLQATVFKFF